MKSQLVSEARPIPPKQLSDIEKDQLSKANEWIKAVLNEAKLEKSDAEEIDQHRSGRVLFIDGPRGAGKTSLLLTLLDGWKKENEKRENLHVFLPVLDFDPLPRGMPLHGWLLEPWRREAKRLDETDTGARGSTDLTEQLAELFERAVTGWTPAHAEGRGVVEKALTYQEQASGWLETHRLWCKFVGAMLCRRCRCSRDRCRHAHQFVFVIAIDDVDLQVEQLPQLLHAVRLLHHPNVVYVLTGNYEHLRFVLKLDYIHRHGRGSYGYRHGEKQIDKALWDDIKAHSARLRDAFLEKAVPRHAMLTLPHLSFDDVLKFAAGDQTVKDTLHAPTWEKVLPAATRSLPIVTARRAQRVIESHLARPELRTEKLAAALKLTEADGKDADDKKKIAATLELIAALCETSIEVEEKTDLNAKPTFTMQGELTTQLGPILRVWKGDRLKVELTDQPSFVFAPDFDETRPQIKEEAHRALLVQLVTEKTNALVVAHTLEWTPDAGIASTHVEWEPNSTKVDWMAVFHWPWLVKPSATRALELKDLARKMSDLATGSSLSDPKDVEVMVAAWLLENITPSYSPPGESQFPGSPAGRPMWWPHVIITMVLKAAG